MPNSKEVSQGAIENLMESLNESMKVKECFFFTGRIARRTLYAHTGNPFGYPTEEKTKYIQAFKEEKKQIEQKKTFGFTRKVRKIPYKQ